MRPVTDGEHIYRIWTMTPDAESQEVGLEVLGGGALHDFGRPIREGERVEYVGTTWYVRETNLNEDPPSMTLVRL